MVPEPLQGPVVRTVQEGLRSSAHVGRAGLARQVAVVRYSRGPLCLGRKARIMKAIFFST